MSLNRTPVPNTSGSFWENARTRRNCRAVKTREKKKKKKKKKKKTALTNGHVADVKESASGSGRCEACTRGGMPGADVCMDDMAHPLGECPAPESLADVRKCIVRLVALLNNCSTGAETSLCHTWRGWEGSSTSLPLEKKAG